MKKKLFLLLTVVIMFTVMLSFVTTELNSKTIIYCYRAYSDQMIYPCESYPLDCDCITVAGQ